MTQATEKAQSADTHDPEPLFWERGTCPVCGSTTYEEAGDRCKVKRDITDEYQCSGGAADEYESGVPRDGNLYFISPAYLAWVDRKIERERPR